MAKKYRGCRQAVFMTHPAKPVVEPVGGGVYMEIYPDRAFTLFTRTETGDVTNRILITAERSRAIASALARFAGR